LAIKHKSGRVTDVLYNAVVYLNDAGDIQGVFAAARDITERRKLEKQVQDSERLATIGATAGMVGHDIRNPLQAITSDIYLAKLEVARLPDSGEKKSILESLVETEKNVDYINKIVQDLQDYARPLNPKAEESDLKDVFEKLIAKNGLPKNVEVNIKVADDARKIDADSYYLNRIMYNLVTNAVQAMPNGGRLVVSAHREANETVIAVKDSGIGIPKSIQSKMFTVMFTTKSKGQGFGLPVVKRMTKSLGGTVAFKSQEGKGTTFTIRLPQKKQTL
jgi:signal transduction histidine kinase